LWYGSAASILRVEQHFSILKLVARNSFENLISLNPLNAELNPICHLLALLGAHSIFHVSRIRVKRHASKVQNTIIFIKVSELAIIFVSDD